MLLESKGKQDTKRRVVVNTVDFQTDQEAFKEATLGVKEALERIIEERNLQELADGESIMMSHRQQSPADRMSFIQSGTINVRKEDIYKKQARSPETSPKPAQYLADLLMPAFDQRLFIDTAVREEENEDYDDMDQQSKEK